jgi:hypothetical protein
MGGDKQNLPGVVAPSVAAPVVAPEPLDLGSNAANIAAANPSGGLAGTVSLGNDVADTGMGMFSLVGDYGADMANTIDRTNLARHGMAQTAAVPRVSQAVTSGPMMSPGMPNTRMGMFGGLTAGLGTIFSGIDMAQNGVNAENSLDMTGGLTGLLGTFAGGWLGPVAGALSAGIGLGRLTDKTLGISDSWGEMGAGFDEDQYDLGLTSSMSDIATYCDQLPADQHGINPVEGLDFSCGEAIESRDSEQMLGRYNGLGYSTMHTMIERNGGSIQEGGRTIRRPSDYAEEGVDADAVMTDLGQYRLHSEAVAGCMDTSGVDDNAAWWERISAEAACDVSADQMYPSPEVLRERMTGGQGDLVEAIQEMDVEEEEVHDGGGGYTGSGGGGGGHGGQYY